jgi:ribosome-binding factor A
MEDSMAGFKINRVTSDIKIALADILREVKDPRVSKLLSIVKLDVSGDMSYAKVYVSAIEGKEKTEESVKALKGAAGYIRRELGARLKLRKVPELRFVADDSINISANISRIIENFKEDNINDEEN